MTLGTLQYWSPNFTLIMNPKWNLPPPLLLTSWEKLSVSCIEDEERLVQNL